MFVEIIQASKYILNSSKCIRFLSKCSVLYYHFYQIEILAFICYRISEYIIKSIYTSLEIFIMNFQPKNFFKIFRLKIEKILIFIYPITKSQFLLNSCFKS